MNRLYEYFKKISTNGDISHAYLIGNTSFCFCKNDLQNVLSDFLFYKKIDIDNNPDIYIIEPIENSITKDQIKELLDKISTTSQFSGLKVYIITNCENLSDSVYNTLLKTLEEPEDNVYAFLITANMENVGKTIKSRCQNVFISSVSTNVNENDIIDISIDIVNKYEKEKLMIFTDTSFYKKISDRLMLKKVIREIFNIYRNLLYKKLNLENDVSDGMICNASEEELCKKMMAISDLIEKENININKDIFMDKLFINLWRCENENSLC